MNILNKDSSILNKTGKLLRLERIPTDYISFWKFDSSLGDETGNYPGYYVISEYYSGSDEFPIYGTGEFNGCICFEQFYYEPWGYNLGKYYFQADFPSSKFDNFNEYTISFWIKSTASPDEFVYTLLSSSRSMTVSITTDYEFRVQRGLAGYYYGDWTKINNGNWHHIVIRYNHNTDIFSIFFDGAIESSTSSTLSANVGGDHDLYIGNNIPNTCIDHFRIYDYPLSDNQIIKLFKENNGSTLLPTNGLVARWEFEDDVTDSYGTWDLSNSVGAYVSGKVNKCAYFLGHELKLNGDYDNYFLGTRSFSFSCWLKGDFSNSPVIFAYDGINSSPYTRVYLSNNNGTLYFERFSKSDCGGAGGIGVGASSSISTTNWVHVVLVYDNSDHINGTKFYVNGSSIGYTSNTNWETYGDADLVTSTNATGITLSGNNQNNRNAISGGYVDQAYFYSRALSSSEVAQLYNNGNGI